MFLVFQLFTPWRKVAESWKLKRQGSLFIENSMFDELSSQTLKKTKSREIVTFVTSYIFFWGGVNQFWVKSQCIFSFSSFHLSPKGRRELKIRTPGFIFHGESDVRWIIFSFFRKQIFFPKIVSCRKSKNP